MPSEKKKIRVLIVEDSQVVRTLLEYIVREDERLEVAASVSTAEEALYILPAVHPDIISMDVNLPGMDGLEATHRIMTTQPTPILIVSSSVADGEAQTSLEALRAGALTVAEKPVGLDHPQFARQAQQLCNKLVIMSEVPVVRQRQGRYLRNSSSSAKDTGIKDSSRSLAGRTPGTESAVYHWLGIVASTGGPQALVRVLNDLGSDFPLPMLLIQHITAAFVDSFARWLDSVCPFTVVVADEGTLPIRGHVYIAPADQHLILARRAEENRLYLDRGPLVSGQRPSGTRLFSSMAEAVGRRSIGVLLTGMGDDGADGLLALRNAGGYTIAEDQSTAIVYGMPAAAVNRGAAVESLPLPDIGGRILRLVGRGESESQESTERSPGK